MKKRVFTICLALVLSISLFVPLAFAEAECEHSYTDDGDCTTPATCTKCNKVVYVQAAHNFDKEVSYSYEDGNFLSNGKKTIACSNSDCTKTSELDAKYLVDSLGYSIREYERNDATFYSLTSSYIFSADEIKAYAQSLDKDYEYGILCFLPDYIGNDDPIDKDGIADVTTLKLDYTDENGVCDLTIPVILETKVNDEFVYAAYIRFGKDVYYIQSDKIFTNYKELSIASCALVLDKLKNAQ